MDYGFAELVKIMNELREKCPWDKKQTIASLRQMTIEETYELADAVSESDWKSIKEELGDLMLHIVFYSKIAEEQNQFNIQNVIEDICKKLITRHPHIYSSQEGLQNLKEVKNEEDVKQNWEKIKLQEGKKSAMSGVPRSLPALIKAQRIQAKAKQVGFEWNNAKDVLIKIDEELNELEVAINQNNKEEVESEMGDVLFSVINYARFLGVDAEAALDKTNKKFISRFTKMEEAAKDHGKILNDMSLEEMDDLWNKIKKAN